MKKFSSMEDVLDFRTTESEDNYWIEEYWKEAVEIFAANISKTVDFVLDCTDEEFFWLSEIFEKIAGETQSNEFTSALRTRFDKVLAENYNRQNFKSEYMRKYVDYNEYMRSVGEEIDFAEAKVNAENKP